MVIIPDSQSWNVMRYPLGMVIDDPRFHSLPAALEIHGLSQDATDRIADLLSSRAPEPGALSRADILRYSFSSTT